LLPEQMAEPELTRARYLNERALDSVDAASGAVVQELGHLGRLSLEVICHALYLPVDQLARVRGDEHLLQAKPAHGGFEADHLYRVHIKGVYGDLLSFMGRMELPMDEAHQQFWVSCQLAALQLVDRGVISPQAVGAKHGELGHTQFLPGNVLLYAVDGNGDGKIDMNNITDSLASTANFLRQKGWQPGLGYQEGEPNFAVIQQWNAAGVYQRAIAIMARRIDG
jgi:hypothetical protein